MTDFCKYNPGAVAYNCPDQFVLIKPRKESPGFDSPLKETTVRSGNGMPEVAITPSKESGAIVFDINTPLGVTPLLIQSAGPDLSLTPAPIPRTAPVSSSVHFLRPVASWFRS